jgi:transcriptional pleiotropic regulator of transition state genes
VIQLKSTGIVRSLDALGRVVIPKEIRRTLNIEEQDSVEVFINGDQVVLRKYEPGCMLCGNVEDLRNIKGKNFCLDCIAEIKN